MLETTTKNYQLVKIAGALTPSLNGLHLDLPLIVLVAGFCARTILSCIPETNMISNDSPFLSITKHDSYL